MGYARVALSTDTVITALGFPVDTRIVGADMKHSRGNVMLTIQHRDLKDVPHVAGQLLPTVTPTFRTIFQSVVVFLGWGQDA
jgi:hypothetical protein